MSFTDINEQGKIGNLIKRVVQFEHEVRLMDFIQGLQKAIEFMEENMLEPITYADVAGQLYMSSYHFHRIFSMVTGITANEYIRNRRLSMAGQEISMSNIKVIDIALKYGYNSPESFTKAFSRFHGVTPNAARKSGVKLKSFNRLIIKIKLEGGTIMDYRIEKKEPFKLLAKVQKFRNEIISEEGNKEISEFWDESKNNGTIDKLIEKSQKEQIFYGLCSPISKESKYFDYGIGVGYDGSEDPEGFAIWEVKPTLWAVFKCETVEEIGEVWEKIFTEFLPGSDYNMLDDTDFELYDDKSGCFCEIWVPVEKKK